MKYRILILLAGMCIFAGCATRPISNELATPCPDERIIDNAYMQPSVDTGTVIIKRDEGVAGSPCSSRVFVDAKPVADIRVAEKVVLYISEGEHIFSAWPNGLCGGGMTEVKSRVEKGKQISFRIGYGSNGHFSISPTAF